MIASSSIPFQCPTGTLPIMGLVGGCFREGGPEAGSETMRDGQVIY